MADEADFSWNDADIVVRQVNAIAVYTNPRGDIVIWQQATQYGEDDPFVAATEGRTLSRLWRGKPRNRISRRALAVLSRDTARSFPAKRIDHAALWFPKKTISNQFVRGAEAATGQDAPARTDS